MITLKKAERCLVDGVPFNAGNLWAATDHEGTLCVYSYSALIATRKTGELWTTDRKYSMTTSKHLNIVKRAWGLK